MKSLLTWLSALVLLTATAPSGALARGVQEGGQVTLHDVKVAARVKDARTKNRRVTVKFKDGASVTGRVGELRERGFTFEPDGLSAELKRQNAAAVIFYGDVASVRHPSKVRDFFKKVGYGLALGGAYAVVMPINGVAILLGGSSIPGCP